MMRSNENECRPDNAAFVRNIGANPIVIIDQVHGSVLLSCATSGSIGVMQRHRSLHHGEQSSFVSRRRRIPTV